LVAGGGGPGLFGASNGKKGKSTKINAGTHEKLAGAAREFSMISPVDDNATASLSFVLEAGDSVFLSVALDQNPAYAPYAGTLLSANVPSLEVFLQSFHVDANGFVILSEPQIGVIVNG